MCLQFARDLYGAFPVKRLFWVVLTVRWSKPDSNSRSRSSRRPSVIISTTGSAAGEIEMAQSTRTRPTHSVLPARPPLLIPHPPAAPFIPPLHVVDLMTAEGSAAFAATWRVRDGTRRCDARVPDDIRHRAACRGARL